MSISLCECLWEVILIFLIAVGRPIFIRGGTIPWVGDPGLYKLGKWTEHQHTSPLYSLTLNEMKPTPSSSSTFPCPQDEPYLNWELYEPFSPKLPLSEHFTRATGKETGPASTASGPLHKGSHNILPCAPRGWGLTPGPYTCSASTLSPSTSLPIF